MLGVAIHITLKTWLLGRLVMVGIVISCYDWYPRAASSDIKPVGDPQAIAQSRESSADVAILKKGHLHNGLFWLMVHLPLT